MTGVVARGFEEPDEVRTPPQTRVEVLDLGGAKVAHMRFEAGWKWSENIKPVVGTDSCQVRHVGMLTSGALHVEHTDGSSADITAGQVYVIEPGHDAWVIGEDGADGFEFESTAAQTYATAPTG